MPPRVPAGCLGRGSLVGFQHALGRKVGCQKKPQTTNLIRTRTVQDLQKFKEAGSVGGFLQQWPRSAMVRTEIRILARLLGIHQIWSPEGRKAKLMLCDGTSNGEKVCDEAGHREVLDQVAHSNQCMFPSLLRI